MIYTNRFDSLFLALVIATASAPSIAQSAEPPARGPMTFADIDLNADGAVTKQELDEARAKRIAERSQQGYPMRNLSSAPTFEDIDTNGDGFVGPEEFAAHQAEHRARMMQPMPQQ